MKIYLVKTLERFLRFFTKKENKTFPHHKKKYEISC